MAVLPSSSLELTIAVPGFASTTLLPSPSGKEWMEEEEESSNNPRKKLRLTKEQSCYLEESFKQNHTLSPKQKDCLAMQLKLRPRQVEVWFQNRRARSKLKKTEMECEYLKRCFGSLTEQNRRLQRELEQLRAIKVLGPSSVISPLSSTLSMCPRCERVTTTTVTASFIDNAATPVATLSPKVSTPAL